MNTNCREWLRRRRPFKPAGLLLQVIALLCQSCVTGTNERAAAAWEQVLTPGGWGMFSLPWGNDVREFSLNKTVEFSVPSPVEISFAEILIGIGSGRDGYETLVVETNGTVEFTFGDTATGWHKAKLQVTAETLKQLRTVIRTERADEMAQTYHSSVHDGTQAFFSAWDGHARRSTYCNNYFPTEFKNVVSFCVTNVLDPHRQSFRESARADDSIGEQYYHRAFPEEKP